MSIKRTIIKTALLLSFVGLLLGVLLSQQIHFKKKIDTTEFQGTFLEHPRSIKPFHLTGTDQKTFDNSSLKGQWTLVFFGFTHCGYLCPTTMAEIGKMYRLLEDKGIKNVPHVVMISLDPERDTLEKLGLYVTSFHSNFYGARGTMTTIKAMTKEMGIAYAKVAYKNSTDHKNYDIQHSGALMLFNPQGELNAFFTTPHRAELLAKDFMLLVS